MLQRRPSVAPFAVRLTFSLVKNSAVGSAPLNGKWPRAEPHISRTNHKENHKEDRLLFLSIFGLPRGRNVLSSPNIAATSACQSFSEWSLPIQTLMNEGQLILPYGFAQLFHPLAIGFHERGIDQLWSSQTRPGPFLHCAR